MNIKSGIKLVLCFFLGIYVCWTAQVAMLSSSSSSSSSLLFNFITPPTDHSSSFSSAANYRSAFLIVAVLSAPRNSIERMACRATWMRFVQLLNVDGGNTHLTSSDVLIRFFVGTKGLENRTLERLDDESKHYDDVVLLHDVLESYERLPLKTFAVYQWLSLNAVTTNGDHGEYNDDDVKRFVLKTDDDSFVRVDRVALQLRQLLLLPPTTTTTTTTPTSNDAGTCNDGYYVGFFNLGSRPVLNDSSHKWYDPNYDVGDLYPPYALGAGYALSLSLACHVARATTLTKFYAMEDVSTGIWLNSLPLDYCRVEWLWDLMPFIESESLSHEQVTRCEESMLLRSHTHNVAEMYRLFGNYLQCFRMCECCEETPKRKWSNRWAARKARREWFNRQRVERRQLERQLYSGYNNVRLTRVIDTHPMDDPERWIANESRILLI